MYVYHGGSEKHELAQFIKSLYPTNHNNLDFLAWFLRAQLLYSAPKFLIPHHVLSPLLSLKLLSSVLACTALMSKYPGFEVFTSCLSRSYYLPILLMKYHSLCCSRYSLPNEILAFSQPTSSKDNHRCIFGNF